MSAVVRINGRYARGGYVHNCLLLEPLERSFVGAGASVRRETPVSISGGTCFGDLLVEHGGRRILVEAERSPHRITNDLHKGMALEVDELWIVVPDTATARAVATRLRRMSVYPNRGGLFVLTLGQALQRVTNCFPLFSKPNEPSENKQKDA